MRQCETLRVELGMWSAILSWLDLVLGFFSLLLIVLIPWCWENGSWSH